MEESRTTSPRMTMLDDVNRAVHESRDNARAREARQAAQELSTASVAEANLQGVDGVKDP